MTARHLIRQLSPEHGDATFELVGKPQFKYTRLALWSLWVKLAGSDRPRSLTADENSDCLDAR